MDAARRTACACGSGFRWQSCIVYARNSLLGFWRNRGAINLLLGIVRDNVRSRNWCRMVDVRTDERRDGTGNREGDGRAGRGPAMTGRSPGRGTRP